MGEREVGAFLSAPLLVGTKGLDKAASPSDHSSSFTRLQSHYSLCLFRPQNGNGFPLLLVSGSSTPFMELTRPLRESFHEILIWNIWVELFSARTLTDNISKVILWVVFQAVGMVTAIWSLCPPWVLSGPRAPISQCERQLRLWAIYAGTGQQAQLKVRNMHTRALRGAAITLTWVQVSFLFMIYLHMDNLNNL